MEASLRSITLGTILRGFGIVCLIALASWYVHFQARFFLEGPVIVLNDTHGIVHHETTIPITGTARNIVKLTLNGKEIHTNGAGEFTETLRLENGYTIMTMKAWDRFGRETSITREFVYVPEEGV